MQRQLPADQPRQRVHAGLGLRDLGERSQARDAGRVAVVALRLRADHGSVDAARTALEHLAVLVDEEVVADVVPAVGVAVVAGDAEHDRRRVLRPVIVRGHRVVHERDLHVAVDRVRPRRHGVAAPLAARDHGHGRARPPASAPRRVRRPRRRRRRPTRRATVAVGSARTKRARSGARAPAQAQLELVGGAGERGVGTCGRGAARVGPVVAGRVQRQPVGPRAAAAARAHLRLGVGPARPAQPDQVEPARRAQHARGAPAGGGGARPSGSASRSSSNRAGREANARPGERRAPAAVAAAPSPRAWRRVI